MGSPFRVLQVVTYMGRGGLETMLMNYYRHINRDNIQFDFLVHRNFEADYDSEIESLGGKIYRMPRLNPFSPAYFKSLDNFFKNHDYKIVHSHLDCMAGIPLKYAKKNGVPVRIAHSHNSNQTKDAKYFLKLIYKKNIVKYANHLCACGEKAATWMFGKNQKVTIINNAIDIKDYTYSSKTAAKVRKKFGIENELLLGHVGRFNPQKNHDFLIDIFREVVKKEPSAKLILVGDGDGRKSIEKKVRDYGLDKQVIFTGVRSDVSDIMSAMDVFVFPSIYEGLPVTLVEAQVAGLNCLLSDTITDEVCLTDLAEKCSLSDSPNFWADKILNMKKIQRDSYSLNDNLNKYDINKACIWLENFYRTLLHGAVNEK